MDISEIIEISRYYGSDPAYVIAGGGNTSMKDDDVMYVKASGYRLGTIDASGFVALDRKVLKAMYGKQYDAGPEIREKQVKSDLLRSRLYPELNQRPSVEASVHDAIPYRFVVHLHPGLVNGITCSKRAGEIVGELFGDEAVYIPYITPGYILFREFVRQNDMYYEKHGRYPQIFFLQNHGIFVGADTTEEIREIYERVMDAIGNRITGDPDIRPLDLPEKIVQVIPAIRAALSGHTLLLGRMRYNTLIDRFIESERAFEKVAGPFTPDGIVYCRPYPLYIGEEGSPEKILDAFNQKLAAYRAEHGYDPKVVLLKGMGMLAVGDNSQAVDVTLDVFEDLMKIAFYSENFGGPNFMTKEDTDFIMNWEVESYRRKLIEGAGQAQLANKVAVVTGGAQGFGKGIVEGLLGEGCDVAVLDMNAETGKQTVNALKKGLKGNDVVFVRADITNPSDIQRAVYETVKYFGGIDILISNAGVLRAGSLEGLSEEDFDLVTEVNYKGFYLCTKYMSRPMKLQAAYNPDIYMDIIQINSKSGLQGSNKNFAYAGSKFGSIGLVQSFAMELVPDRIKVNAICPGNYFEGPLWSDPERGLFVQYLNTGKVPGAETIADVKRFYEQKVPMRRGCYPEDVTRAIVYAVEQVYETGQAIPVSGGQVMLH